MIFICLISMFLICLMGRLRREKWKTQGLDNSNKTLVPELFNGLNWVTWSKGFYISWLLTFQAEQFFIVQGCPVPGMVSGDISGHSRMLSLPHLNNPKYLKGSLINHISWKRQRTKQKWNMPFPLLLAELPWIMGVYDWDLCLISGAK